MQMKHAYSLLGLLLSPTLVQAQNTCATALPITAGIHTVAIVDGSDVPDPICAANGPGASAGEWYTYTPTQDYTINLSTDLSQNTGIDTRFHVYTGTCGALSCHDGDDDGGSGYLSVSTFNVFQGVTYYIAFDDRWDNSGFDFLIEETPYVEPIVPPVTFTANPIGTISGTYRVCVVDMNGDFLDDIVTVSDDQVQIHYQGPISGSFNNSTINTTVADFLPTWSLAAGDIDKNGFNDLLYGNGTGVTFMQANATGSGFTEISGPEYVFSQRSNFVDLNNDGHLDAFVCHDVDPNVYYMNDGSNNLNFYQGGLGDHSEGGNYGSIWTDYDNDGDVDLFIAKCRGGTSTAKINELHRNDGGGVFTDVSATANMDDPVQTWSSAWNDYDNDGWMDALVGASSNADGTHKLMHNNGDGTFSDITAGSGWDTNPSLNIEHISYDFDNDGFADVFGGGNKIMFNNGDLTFSPSVYSFTNGPIGDLNNDGFLDIQNGGTVYFNDGNSNNWVKITLQGVQSNGNGIGTRVEIYGDWGKQIRDVRSGEGFKYMNTLNVHFGIGEATEIDSVYINWPSGHTDVLYEPTINGTHHVVEGSSPLGLLTVDGQSIEIYPNPTSDKLNISNFELISSNRVAIYSHTGQFIKDVKHSSVSVQELASGLYILRIELPDGPSFAETFIKE